ncbi:MAG: BamA/TamA family outer membrane protein, partial [Acidobacteriota bacterium]|nr:BamA/TamA family outer membrane protein [Acidobacteriota bacterium]
VRGLPARTLGGQLGYTSDGGLAMESRWSHRNVLGGGQTLEVGVAGQSGWLSLDRNPEQFVRGSINIRHPAIFARRATLTYGPTAEYRDDYRDRSFETGFGFTVVRPLGGISSLSLSYAVSTRRIYEYRFSDISAGIDLLELLQLSADGVLDELGARLNRSVATLGLSILDIDSPTDPTRGYSIEPTLSTTVFPALNTSEFVSAQVKASGYVPIGGAATLAARIGAGRLFPFGKTVPVDTREGLRNMFRLREDLFTAGGSRDVRGWSERMLGPKFPNMILNISEETDSITLDSDRYTPLGGLNRVHGTVELRFPMTAIAPGVSSHVFVDAGRIWTTDDRFVSPGDPYGVAKLFWSTGAGFDVDTPVGSFRLTVGYKLNPSFIDLADPDDALRALLEGTPPDAIDVEEHPIRRFRLHIGFGRLM